MKILRESSLPTMKGQSFFDVFNEKNEEEISIAELKSYKLSKYNIIESFDTSVIVLCFFDNTFFDTLFFLRKSNILHLRNIFFYYLDSLFRSIPNNRKISHRIQIFNPLFLILCRFIFAIFHLDK